MEKNLGYIYTDDMDSDDEIVLPEADIDGECMIIQIDTYEDYVRFYNTDFFKTIDNILKANEEDHIFLLIDRSEYGWIEKESSKLEILKFIKSYHYSPENLKLKEFARKFELIINNSLNKNWAIVSDFENVEYY